MVFNSTWKYASLPRPGGKIRQINGGKGLQRRKIRPRTAGKSAKMTADKYSVGLDSLLSWINYGGFTIGFAEGPGFFTIL